MRPVDPMQPGRWCEEHARYDCTRQRKRGGDCHGPAITGLDSCRMHAGVTGEVAKAQGAAITAWSALAGSPTVTSTDAVLGMLQMSWLRVHMYAGLLEQQVTAEQAVREAGGRPVELVIEETEDDDDWSESVRRDDVGPGVGLIGHTRSGVKGIGIFSTGEAPRGLALLEAQERDRVVKFAKVAHDMGIADAQVRILDEYASQVSGLITRILDGLELNPAQRQLVSVVVPRELMRLAG